MGKFASPAAISGDTEVARGPVGHGVFSIQSREGEFNADTVQEAAAGHPSLF